MGDSRTDETVSHCCILHTFERAERVCHDCGHWHCDACLVTPWGPKKASLCVSCAIARGGIRKTATNAPARPVAEIRKLERESRRRSGKDEPSTKRSLHRQAGAVAQARDDLDTPKRGLLSRLRSSA